MWTFWTQSAKPRLNDQTSVVVMFHRYREDDFAGRLLAEEPDAWTLYRFPAICDSADDPCGRTLGEPLTPRYSAAFYTERQQDQATWLSQFQGTPAPAGGNLFRESWFSVRYDTLPPLQRVATFWDTAMKTAEQNDETACLTVGLGQDGLIYLLRATHGRWETPDTARFLAQQAEWFRRAYGDLYVGDYVEDKVSGTSLIQYLRRTHPELVVIPVQVDADKVTRAHGVTPLCETGRVRFPDLAAYPEAQEGMTAMLKQLLVFPVGKHDDCVDVFVYALKWLLGTLGTRKSRRGKAGGYL